MSRFRTPDYEHHVQTTRNLMHDAANTKRNRTAKGTAARPQVILSVKVQTVNSNDITTYDVIVLSGKSRTESSWVISRVMSSDPAVTFDVDDYALCVYNEQGISFLIGSSSGAGTGFTITLQPAFATI